MSKPVLTREDFERAAAELDCEVAAIAAVCEVESPRGGFLPDGRPTILVERHKFFKYTQGRYAGSHPDVCNADAGGYATGRNALQRQLNEWKRFEKACSLDRDAAIMSTSFGRFQLMGFNFGICGFDSVEDFFQAMGESEQEQLSGFVNYVKNCSLDDEIRDRQWRAFARGYNGPGYRVNRYDEKLERAYKKYAALEKSRAMEVRRSEAGSTDPDSVGQPQSHTPSLGTPLMCESIKVSRNGFKAWVTTAGTSGAGIVAGVAAFLKDNRHALAIAASVICVALILWFARSIILDRERMRIAADPYKQNVH